MEIHERHGYQNCSGILANRFVNGASSSGECTTHDDFTVVAINAAGSFNQRTYAGANRYVYEYVSIVSTVQLTSYGQVLQERRLSFVNCFCYSCAGLTVDYNSLCCTWKLAWFQFDTETFSYNGSFFTHRIDVRKQVSRDCRFICKKLVQLYNSIVMFLLNSDDCFVCSGDFHCILDTLDYLLRLSVKLLNVVSQSRFTLGSVNQNVSISIEVSVQLNSGWESCSTHSDNTGCLNHFQRCSFRNLLIIFALFFIWFDDDSVF